MLLTVCVPEECVTVMLAPAPITTVSLAPGKEWVLQLVVVFQSPLPPTQETVAADKELARRISAAVRERVRHWRRGARTFDRMCFITVLWGSSFVLCVLFGSSCLAQFLGLLCAR